MDTNEGQRFKPASLGRATLRIVNLLNGLCAMYLMRILQNQSILDCWPTRPLVWHSLERESCCWTVRKFLWNEFWSKTLTTGDDAKLWRVVMTGFLEITEMPVAVDALISAQQSSWWRIQMTKNFLSQGSEQPLSITLQLRVGLETSWAIMLSGWGCRGSQNDPVLPTSIVQSAKDFGLCIAMIRLMPALPEWGNTSHAGLFRQSWRSNAILRPLATRVWTSSVEQQCKPTVVHPHRSLENGSQQSSKNGPQCGSRSDFTIKNEGTFVEKAKMGRVEMMIVMKMSVGDSERKRRRKEARVRGAESPTPRMQHDWHSLEWNCWGRGAFHFVFYGRCMFLWSVW